MKQTQTSSSQEPSTTEFSGLTDPFDDSGTWEFVIRASGVEFATKPPFLGTAEMNVARGTVSFRWI